MALRVLLADESTTIKRVIQLALQDYSVEVKSVPVGLDVLPVTKSYKPDVIFADILLPKRNGYDVCQEIKSDSETQQIPVILMWSSFMEFDEKKSAACMSNGRLEKPFETEQLRSLVQSLVPKLKTNPISSFLKFPKLPEMTEKSAEPHSIDESPPVENLELSEEDLDSHEPLSFDFQSPDESFQQIPLHRPAESTEDGPTLSHIIPKEKIQEESSWEKQDLNEFKLNLPQAELQVDPHFDEYEASGQNMESSFEEISYEAPRPEPRATPPKNSALDLVLTEKILREEAQKMIENMIWKILPEIAERVVREEINKLLKDTEKNI